MKPEGDEKMPLSWETITMRGSRGLDFDKLPWSIAWESKHWEDKVREL